MTSNNNETQVKRRRGRPSVKRTPAELKEYLKLRSRLYYENPENKERQRLKMIDRRKVNTADIYERCNKAKRLKTFERRLKKIWISKGLIIGKV
tara:strand:- start:548 stop:829 length:282 start_codon:yes stop_codon:yes gene_type:complete